MAISLTTELDAINTMLSIIGEAPVNSVEDTGVIDAVLARQILTETSRQVQATGWHWNIEYGVKLQPTFPTPGDIYVPANTISVDAEDTSIDVVQRGVRLYDRKNRTYKFSSPITVTLKLLLEFEELPQIARHYIMIRSGRIFQDRVVGSQTLAGFNEKDEKVALVTLRNDEAENGDYNVMSNWSVGRVLARRGGGLR